MCRRTRANAFHTTTLPRCFLSLPSVCISPEGAYWHRHSSIRGNTASQIAPPALPYIKHAGSGSEQRAQCPCPRPARCLPHPAALHDTERKLILRQSLHGMNTQKTANRSSLSIRFKAEVCQTRGTPSPPPPVQTSHDWLKNDFFPVHTAKNRTRMNPCPVFLFLLSAVACSVCRTAFGTAVQPAAGASSGGTTNADCAAFLCFIEIPYNCCHDHSQNSNHDHVCHWETS